MDEVRPKSDEPDRTRGHSVSQTSRGGAAVKSTKTGRCHAVALIACAAEALASRREIASKAAAASQREVCRESFVFSSDPLGRVPWRPSLVTRRWATLREDAGIGRVRVHDLRHFVATELLTAGVNVRTVAKSPRSCPPLDDPRRLLGIRTGAGSREPPSTWAGCSSRRTDALPGGDECPPCCCYDPAYGSSDPS